MKAIQAEAAGGLEKLKLIDMPSPKPGEGQVLIRVKSAGVAIWDEEFLQGGIPELKPQFPVVPGWEGSGIIKAVGQGVNRFKEGDEVIFFDYPQAGMSGAWAEEVVVRASCVGRKAKSLSFDEGGGLAGIALTPFQALRKALHLRSGQSILICNGAGGVGTCAIQLARIMGARVLALASSANHELVKSLGAEAAFDYHQDFAPEVKKLFPQGVDFVFDNIGEHATVQKAMPCVKSGGKFVTIVEQFEDLKRGDVSSSFFAVEPSSEDIEELGRLVDEGKFRIVVDQVFPLERFREALEKVEGRHAHGKIVLRVA